MAHVMEQKDTADLNPFFQKHVQWALIIYNNLAYLAIQVDKLAF